jgi:hypothetical protein
VLPKSISASDVGQTFLSAGSGDFPVPGFRVKLSASVGEVEKLRNRQARKPALQFGQHALDTPTNDGRANLPVCPNLTASKRSDAGGTMGYACQNIAPLVLLEVWAARQRRPTLVV